MPSQKARPRKIHYDKTSAITLISLIVMSMASLVDSAIFGFSTLDLTSNLYPICLKTGTALLLVFVFSHRALFGIFLGTFTSLINNLEADLNSQVIVFYALQGIAICLQAQVIHLSFTRGVSKGNPLSSNQNLITFIGITSITTLMISFLMNLNISTLIAQPLSATKVITLFLTNLTSLITVPSLFFTLKNHNTRVKQNTHPLEWLVWLSTSVMGIYFAINLYPAFVLIIVFLFMWAATRFNQLTCCISVLVGSFLSAFFFNESDINQWFQDLPIFTPQLITLLLIMSTLYFSALRSDQRRMEFKLEEIVEQRTRDLILANQELHDEVFNREQAEKSSQYSSSHYKALFETAGIPIIVLDSKFKIKQWNTAAEMQFSYTKESVLGKNFISMFIPEPIQDETSWKFTKVLESGMNKENMDP